MSVDDDPFFRECIEEDSGDESESDFEDEGPRDAQTFTTQGRLARGKERREDLKAAMQRADTRRRNRRRGL
jgi:hypothetical protein